MSEIKGYNPLSDHQKFLINQLKTSEEELLMYLKEIEPYVDERWLVLAIIDFERGFMSAVRSITKPKTIEF